MDEILLYYAVYKEHTLGYLFTSEGRYMLGILHTSVLKGSHYNYLSGPILVEMKDIRKATKDDFEDYRVSIPCDFATLQK